ncbi:hypothetical protein VN97_g6496 [Penicillium thymicola]|uniref:Uncharacterized protein n=1 Tax=Penicillium thymicola TaxID=293382 RepID=A0AAI9X7K0_PENTH|nr:hypothetical protein VN97_g6496 [Penicillium thymicola]
MHASSRHHNLRGEHVELVGWGVEYDVEGAFFCRVRRENLDETCLSKGKDIIEHECGNEDIKIRRKKKKKKKKKKEDKGVFGVSGAQGFGWSNYLISIKEDGNSPGEVRTPYMTIYNYSVYLGLFNSLRLIRTSTYI